MYNPSRDLAVLTAMADDFEPFIQSDVVYWQLSDAGPFLARNPKLTVGGLLLHRHRLAALHISLTPDEESAYTRLDADLDIILGSWKANLERKALREIKARLGSWAWYLDECADSPSACSSSYQTDVYARTYLQLLFEVVPESSSNVVSARANLAQLDSQLRIIFIPDGFMWDHNLAPAFPKTEFWFLYGSPGV